MTNFKYQQDFDASMPVTKPYARTVSAVVVIAIISLSFFPVICLEPDTVEAKVSPNRHAVLEVEYSPSRPPDISEERVYGEIEIELYEKRAPITTAASAADLVSGPMLSMSETRGKIEDSNLMVRGSRRPLGKRWPPSLT